MRKQIILNFSISLIVLAVSFFVVLNNSGESLVRAQTTPTDTQTTWKATKLLALDVVNPTSGTSKNTIALGPAEWQVTYNTRDEGGTLVPVYTETWSIPTYDEKCYEISYDCNAASKMNEHWLWGSSTYGLHPTQINRNQLATTTFGLRTVETASQDIRGTLQSNGSAFLRTFSSTTTQFNTFLQTVGAYGWQLMAETTDGPAAGFKTLRTGTMIPLEWTVTGSFK